MENFYRENLEEKIIFCLCEQRKISTEEAMHRYYTSKLSEDINAGKYGIQHLDYTILVDLLEEELNTTEQKERKEDDLFFTCSLIAYIARKTKNKPSDIVQALGVDTLDKIYDLADVYHSDNIDRVSDDFIEEKGISMGDFDNVEDCMYSVPSHWDIGKVYKRLILMVAEDEDKDVIDALIEVYQSSTSTLIEDYNSSFYYDNPQTIFATYQNNGIPE